jgi:hypothetical protein
MSVTALKSKKTVIFKPPVSLKIFYHHCRQRLKFFTTVADSALKCLAMSATALKSKKTVIFKPKPSKRRSKIFSGDGDGATKI